MRNNFSLQKKEKKRYSSDKEDTTIYVGGDVMDFSSIVSEDKIKRAYKNGEFDNLPGYGKKMKLEDLSSIPEDLRMAYKMMKNAGMIDNEETALKKELLSIEDLLDKCEDDDKRVILQQRLNQKQLRMSQMLKKRGSSNSSVFKDYQNRINDKFR